MLHSTEIRALIKEGKGKYFFFSLYFFSLLYLNFFKAMYKMGIDGFHSNTDPFAIPYSRTTLKMFICAA